MPVFIPESRGWVFGRLDGPHLDLLPGRPAEWRRSGPAALEATLEDLASRMIARLLFPPPPGRLPSPSLPPGARSLALTTGDGAYVLRLNLPPGVAPLDALYRIEWAEGGLPAFLLAPFVQMALRPPLPEESPAETAARMGALAFLVHRHEGGRGGRARPMDREQARDALIPRLWQAASMVEGLEAIGSLPLGGTDAVRVVLEAGEALWIAEKIPAEDPTPAGFLLALQIARVAQPVPGRDWSIGWETVRTRRAGRPGPPPDWPALQAAYTRGLAVLLGEPPSPDADLARGLLQALMARAGAEGRFVPAGRFRVQAPDLPLFRRAGVTALRIAADPRGIWVQLLGERGPGEIFRLDIELPLRPDIAADPRWGAAAAAVWHDLRTGTPAPPRDEARESRPGKESPAEAGRLAPPSGPRPLVLPRPFRVPAAEEPEASPGTSPEEPEVEWGEPAERERLRRALHLVRGHVRRLPPGWTASGEAREAAEAFGMVLPEGYTFVRPHLRGGGEEQPGLPPEREAIARGLRSLALLE